VKRKPAGGDDKVVVLDLGAAGSELAMFVGGDLAVAAAVPWNGGLAYSLCIVIA
jgi:hypothetical protein